MSDIVFVNKMEIQRNGCVPFDVVVGDIVEVNYEIGALGVEKYVGKIIEIGVDAIKLDCSLAYSSNVQTLQKTSIYMLRKLK